MEKKAIMLIEETDRVRFDDACSEAVNNGYQPFSYNYQFFHAQPGVQEQSCLYQMVMELVNK